MAALSLDPLVNFTILHIVISKLLSRRNAKDIIHKVNDVSIIVFTAGILVLQI